MPILFNVQHEKFALYLFQGLSQPQAYEKAGYNPHDGNASRLAHQENIRERVAELHAQAAAVAALDKSYVIGGLIEMLHKSSQERELLDRKGRPTGKMTYDSPGVGKALELLGKHLKLYTDKIDLRTIKSIEDLTEEERTALLADLEARVKEPGEGEDV